MKAAVGEDVSTPYGEGKIIRYRLFDNKYEIKLGWGSHAMLHANAETFDRIDDRLEDEGGFNMGWILISSFTPEEMKRKMMKGPSGAGAKASACSAKAE